MKRLTVYYDGRCGLCTRLVSWLRDQRQLVPLECQPKGPNSGDDLVVAADTGQVWSGDAAWLIVLWALDDYRDWAYRLARPALLPLARQAFATLSENRSRLSAWMRLAADEAVVANLRDVAVPGCRTTSHAR